MAFYREFGFHGVKRGTVLWQKRWMMRNFQHANGLSKQDLRAIARGESHVSIDDMEFFETLASNHCLVMSPWVYHVDSGGALEKVTPVRYGMDYSLDKPSMLLALMERLPQMAGAAS